MRAAVKKAIDHEGSAYIGMRFTAGKIYDEKGKN
jgi:hypothetical protein